MVARRTRQRVGSTHLAVGHGIERAHREIDRAGGCGPRAGEHRVVVVRVPAERGDRMLRSGKRLPANHAGVRNRLRVDGCARRHAPPRMNVLEELDVGLGVHTQQLPGPVRLGRVDRAEIGSLDRDANAFGPLGNFGRDHHVTLVVERLPGMVLAVRVRREREHPSSCSTPAAGAGVPTSARAYSAGTLEP